MATTIAKLNIHLGAQVTALEQGLQSAQSQITDFSNSASRSLSDIGGFGGGKGGFLDGLVGAGGLQGLATKLGPIVAGIAAAAGAAKVAMDGLSHAAGRVADQFQRVGEAAVVAKKLGVTIGELEGLRIAAQRAGVGAGALDDSMQSMVERIAEAARGGGEGVEALKALGLSAERLNLMGPAQQFREIGDAMSNLKTQGDRVLFAIQLFGDEGAGLVNVFADGAAALDEAAAAAEAFGLNVSQVDAASIADANAAVHEMSKAFEGMWTQIAIIAAPVVKAFAEEITVLAQKAAQFISDFRPYFTMFANVATAALREVFGLVNAIVDQMRWIADAEASIAKRMGFQMRVDEEPFKVVGQQLDGLQASFQTFNAGDGIRVKVHAADMATARKALEALDLQMRDTFHERALAMPQSAEFAAAAKEFEDRIKSMQAAADRVSKSVAKEVVKPGEAFADTMGELNQLLGLGLITLDEFGAAAKKANTELEAAAQELAGMNELARESQQLQYRGVAAVTRGSSAAFSAVQAGQFQAELKAERDRLHKEHMAKLEAVRKELREQARNRVQVNQVSL